MRDIGRTRRDLLETSALSASLLRGEFRQGRLLPRTSRQLSVSPPSAYYSSSTRSRYELVQQTCDWCIVYTTPLESLSILFGDNLGNWLLKMFLCERDSAHRGLPSNLGGCVVPWRARLLPSRLNLTPRFASPRVGERLGEGFAVGGVSLAPPVVPPQAGGHSRPACGDVRWGCFTSRRRALLRGYASPLMKLLSSEYIRYRSYAVEVCSRRVQLAY